MIGLFAPLRVALRPSPEVRELIVSTSLDNRPRGAELRCLPCRLVP
jgi:hypothetical protein